MSRASPGHETRKSSSRRRSRVAERKARITLDHMARFPMSGNPERARGDFQNAPHYATDVCPTCRRIPRLTSLLPPSLFPLCPRTLCRTFALHSLGHRRLIRGINSARVTKNRGRETTARFTMSRVRWSLGFPHARDSTSLLIFRHVTRNFSFPPPPCRPPPALFSSSLRLPDLETSQLERTRVSL